MNAKNVLLTHFSQRYAKIPVMKNCTPVAVAFDHMQVSHPVYCFGHFSVIVLKWVYFDGISTYSLELICIYSCHIMCKKDFISRSAAVTCS